jgi:hypothetical protein
MGIARRVKATRRWYQTDIGRRNQLDQDGYSIRIVASTSVKSKTTSSKTPQARRSYSADFGTDAG